MTTLHDDDGDGGNNYDNDHEADDDAYEFGIILESCWNHLNHCSNKQNTCALW